MNRIRELRKQRKLTQKELAKHLKIADSTLSYWEMGRYEPDNKSLMKLADFFHVSIDHILSDEANEGNNTHYSGAENQRFSDTKLLVAEQKVKYVKNPLYERKEFDDLTREEIDKLAEYALFLKSRREHQDE